MIRHREQIWRVPGPDSPAEPSPSEKESDFRTLAESLPQLVFTTLPGGRHDYFNRRWYEFTGLTPDQSLGDGWQDALHPEDRDLARERWREALAAAGPYEIEYRICSKDGRYLHFLGRALPIRADDGSILRWFGTCTEIEAQKKAEEALRRLDEQHRLALEAADLGTWDLAVASGIASFDRRACRLFGLDAEGIRSIPVEKSLARIHEEDREPVRNLIAAAIEPSSDGRFDAEYRVVLPDTTTRWLHSRGQTFFSGDRAKRRAVRLSGVVSDVTQRRHNEEAQLLVARELNHRVKNLFAIASGMVAMTARTAHTPKDMADALRGRLGALARAHELVRPAVAAVDQAGQGTTVDRLIDAILAPYSQPGTKRLQVEGPAISVGAHSTTSLALVLHELATNAAKYGCLSSGDGRLSIRWTVDGNALHLAWVEAGGPALAEAPSAEGFGTLLARKSVAGQLGGTLVHDWANDGLEVRMTIPLDRIAL